VHDELLFEVPEEEMEIMSKFVPEVMSSAMKLSVPLKVDPSTGSNWV
jgi:DNA polymerase-1